MQATTTRYDYKIRLSVSTNTTILEVQGSSYESGDKASKFPKDSGNIASRKAAEIALFEEY